MDSLNNKLLDREPDRFYVGDKVRVICKCNSCRRSNRSETIAAIVRVTRAGRPSACYMLSNTDVCFYFRHLKLVEPVGI